MLGTILIFQMWKVKMLLTNWKALLLSLSLPGWKSTGLYRIKLTLYLQLRKLHTFVILNFHLWKLNCYLVFYKTTYKIFYTRVDLNMYFFCSMFLLCCKCWEICLHEIFKKKTDFKNLINVCLILKIFRLIQMCKLQKRL